MKQILRSLLPWMCCLLIIPVIPVHAAASEWWLLGTVKGENIKEKTIAVQLFRLDDAGETPVSRTTINKSGQYAFSDPGEGLPPKAYKIVLKVSSELSIDISLENIEPQGWKPSIIPPVTVYW